MRRKIDDILREKGITQEEAEKLGLTDLVNECRKREEELEKIEQENLEKLKELEKSCVGLFTGLEELKKVADRALLEITPKNRMYNA